MHSGNNSASHRTPDTSDRAAPGWLLVIPWSLRSIGGVNQVVKSLIVEFRDGGIFFPHLLAGPDEPASNRGARQELIKAHLLDLWSPVDHKHPFRAWFSFLYRLPLRCWVMRRMIQQHNIRIINPHFPGLASLVFLVLKKMKLFEGKVILSFHGTDIHSALCTKGRERKLWKLLLRGADHIAVVSDDLAKRVLELDSAVAAKITTIHNGVDLAFFTPAGHEPSARPSISKQDKAILSVGAFISLKGHDVLVRAFSLVVREIPNVRLFLVGRDGPDLKIVRDLINQLSLTEKVFIYTDVPYERIPSILAQAQLFVLASHREGLPLVVIEAGAAGVPVVCTRTTGSQELISDKITGRLVEIGDEPALAEAMIDLLSHPEEAQRLAVRFHEYVKSNLTWKQTYEKYLQIAGD